MTITYDLRYLAAGVSVLKDYLLSQELFWPVDAAAPAGEPAYPKLTLGNLLLALARLENFDTNRQMDSQQQEAFDRLAGELETIKRTWPVAWEGKGRHEINSRLRQWGLYLDELHKKKENHAPYYNNEVRLRVVLQVLIRDLGEDSPPELEALDALLRAWLTPGDFLWEEGFQAAFPQEAFWFLYGDVKG